MCVLLLSLLSVTSFFSPTKLCLIKGARYCPMTCMSNRTLPRHAPHVIRSCVTFVTLRLWRPCLAFIFYFCFLTYILFAMDFAQCNKCYVFLCRFVSVSFLLDLWQIHFVFYEIFVTKLMHKTFMSFLLRTFFVRHSNSVLTLTLPAALRSCCDQIACNSSVHVRAKLILPCHP